MGGRKSGSKREILWQYRPIQRKKKLKKKQPDLPYIKIRKNKQTNKKNKQKQRQEKEGHHKDQRINK